jgi:glycosyltransferase involved in cell wall biosynthesis
MNCGAPVVSSNYTCLPEIYKDAAIYFDPLDIDDMVSKIYKVIKNEKERNRIILNGYKLVKSYSWRKMAEETLSIYNSII